MNAAVDRGDLQYWPRHFGMGIAMSIALPTIVLVRTHLRTDIPVHALSFDQLSSTYVVVAHHSW